MKRENPHPHLPLDAHLRATTRAAMTTAPSPPTWGDCGLSKPRASPRSGLFARRATVSTWIERLRHLEGRKARGSHVRRRLRFPTSRDIEHPQWGMQRSMLNILADFRAAHPRFFATRPSHHELRRCLTLRAATPSPDRLCGRRAAAGMASDWRAGAIATGACCGIAKPLAGTGWQPRSAGEREEFPHIRRGIFTSIDTGARRPATRSRRRPSTSGERAPNPAARIFAYPGWTVGAVLR